MHTVLAYDPRKKPQNADGDKGESNEKPLWESRAKPLFNPKAETDSGDSLEKMIRRWLARKSPAVGEKDKKGPIDSVAEKEHNNEISDESLTHDSYEHLRPKLKTIQRSQKKEISEEREERSQGRRGEDHKNEMQKYLEMKRDDPKLFGPTGAGKNEIRMEQKEDEEDDDEESSHLGSNFSLRRQMLEPDDDEEEEEEGESEGVRSGDMMKRKQPKSVRKMLAGIKGSIQSNHGKQKRKGKNTKRKKRQQRKNRDIEEQNIGYEGDEEFPEMHKEYHNYEDDEEYRAEMQKEFRSYQREPIPEDFDLLKNIADSTYDEPYYESNYN